ncbi:MAG: sel1 repeat family protein [Rhodospirillaceae bacterium]|nr:sel1 repeat family protein [Rhodospirillaceae bacterium]
MAIRLELTADAVRGPGYGHLRIHGLPPVDQPVRLWVQRNQGTEPFLGRGVQWVTQSVLHELPPPVADGDLQTLSLGPELVNPIALLPPNCMVMIGVEANGIKDQGRVVIRQLLPSAAAGEGADNQTQVVRHTMPDEPVVPEPMLEPEPTLTIEPEDVPLVADPVVLVDPPKNKLSPAVLGMVAGLVLLAGTAGLYFAGLLPFATSQTTDAVRDVAAVKAEVVKPEADGVIDSREALGRYLAGNPSASAATAKADELAAQKKLDFAMLIYQYASRLGSVEAALALGHVYDPDTWSKETSPMERPDAETAAYWYEPAARAGNVEAQRRLGKILLALPQGGIQKDKGKDWLGKAAAAGDAEAKALLDAVK